MALFIHLRLRELPWGMRAVTLKTILMATDGLGEVDIVSTETVKPSSPSPQRLLIHRLSWIDQIMPSIHNCVVLFYLGDGGSGDIPEKLRRLKRSLSKVLALYYPLAGRLDGNSAVICTDDGVDFIEARASCQLSTLFRQPEMETVDRLLPCSRRCSAACDGGPLLTVQATAFDCGGLAVGVCVYHKVADGMSLAVFLDTWAAVAQGKPGAESRRPLLEMASAFPPVQEVPTSTDGLAMPKRRLVVRRFVLDGSKICELREKVAEDEAEAERRPPGLRLTRVQAVSALLWRCLIRALSGEGGSPTGKFMAAQSVDLRRRMEPPLPETAFGNVVAEVATRVLLVPNEHVSDDGGGGDTGINIRRVTEEQISAAIRKVDAGYIRRTLQVPEGPSAYFGTMLDYLSRGVRVVWFSSLWGFPFYETDFGWGRPAWVARAGSGVVPLVVTLMGRPTEGGGHMEAWVTLGTAEMRRFQGDPELLSLLASSDPLTSLLP